MDYVVFRDKLPSGLVRRLELAGVGSGDFRSCYRAAGLALKDKEHMRRLIPNRLGRTSLAELVFAGRHESHAASGLFPRTMRKWTP
jgi:hypothetical protein